jgi:predicted ABC-type ATPase
MHKHQPIFFIFAGNNGSGKNTLRNLIIDKLGVEINIDPDAIARRLDPENPENKRVSAGKEVLRSVKQYIKEGKDFSIETTLAGKNSIKQMQEAKEMGYELTMFYIALSNVEQNIERVAMRINNGGHNIHNRYAKNLEGYEANQGHTITSVFYTFHLKSLRLHGLLLVS